MNMRIRKPGNEYAVRGIHFLRHRIFRMRFFGIKKCANHASLEHEIAPTRCCSCMRQDETTLEADPTFGCICLRKLRHLIGNSMLTATQTVKFVSAFTCAVLISNTLVLFKKSMGVMVVGQLKN